MSQISRRFLQQKTIDKIIDIFLSSLSKINDKVTMNEFFSEFLTPTEKIMLAKRLVCLYLIYKKLQIKQIADAIKMSTGTVSGYKILLDKSPAIKKILKTIFYEEKFSRAFDTFINEYLFPPLIPGRNWTSSLSSYYDYKRKKDSPLNI